MESAIEDGNSESGDRGESDDDDDDDVDYEKEIDDEVRNSSLYIVPLNKGPQAIYNVEEAGIVTNENANVIHFDDFNSFQNWVRTTKKQKQ